MRRLKGSGTVPRVFALAVLVIVGVFLAVWVAADGPRAMPWAIGIGALALLLLIRARYVGVFVAGDSVVVMGWFRTYIYGPGDLTKVTVVPYWRFLDAKDPILSLLKFTPAQGWVREISATVSWKDRTEAQAAEIRRHLAIEGPE